jgi:hypothetical protein
VTAPSWTTRLSARSSGDLAALLPPHADEFGFVIAHDDARIGAADEGAAVPRSNRLGTHVVELVGASLVLLRCAYSPGSPLRSKRRYPPPCVGPAQNTWLGGASPESAVALLKISDAPFGVESQSSLSKNLALFRRAEQSLDGLRQSRRSLFPRLQCECR